MIYLIGVIHSIQHNGHSTEEDLGKRKEFQKYISDKIDELNISVIGEELSEECLIREEAEFSICNKIAEKFCIEHRYCDPDTNERNVLGIPIKDLFEIELKKKYCIADNESLDIYILKKKNNWEEIKKEREKFEND